MNIAKVKLGKALLECERHIGRLNSSYKKMQVFMPLNVAKYNDLTEDNIEHIDQYLYRFSKLQDAIGQRLFKSVFIVLEEEIESKSFIDIFNKLEQLKIISDYDKWLELRVVRNELSHEYEDDPEENTAKINRIFELKDDLVSYYVNIKNYLIDKNIL